MSCSTHSGVRGNSGYVSDTDTSTVCSDSSPRVRRDSASSFSLHKFVQSLSRRKMSTCNHLLHPDKHHKLPVYHGRRRGGVCQALGADAVHVAAQHNDADALALLIWSGADKTCVDANNKTALQVAKESNKNGSHTRIIEMLAAWWLFSQIARLLQSLIKKIKKVKQCFIHN